MGGTLLWAGRASAVELGDGAISINGFGGTAYGRTTNENVYLGRAVVGTEGGNFENSAFGLTVNAHPAPNFSVAGQIDALGEELEIDWGFADYRVMDAVRVRAGKVKHPFGLWAEIFEVGTLRPFYDLPVSIYGAADMTGESYIGAGVTGTLGETWSLSYDAYGGTLALEVFEPFEFLEAGAATPDLEIEVEEEELTDLIGGRVFVGTPVEGLRFGLSGWWGAEYEDDEAKHAATGLASVELNRGWLVARTEAAYHESPAETTLAGYVEASAFVGSHFQVAARLENSMTEVTEEPELDSPLTRHQEAALGLNFWVNPGFVVKTSVHAVDGNRYAVPEDLGEAILADEIEEQTLMFVLGTQFSF